MIWVATMPFLSNLLQLYLSQPRSIASTPSSQLDVLAPIRRWLNSITIQHPRQAHLICQLIPSQCPFARDIYLCGRLWMQIPPLCKLNPLYEEVISLRFRALCYLADVCGQDIHRYC